MPALSIVLFGMAYHNYATEMRLSKFFSGPALVIHDSQDQGSISNLDSLNCQ